jgi:hypothetical protein
MRKLVMALAGSAAAALAAGLLAGFVTQILVS